MNIILYKIILILIPKCDATREFFFSIIKFANCAKCKILQNNVGLSFKLVYVLGEVGLGVAVGVEAGGGGRVWS